MKILSLEDIKARIDMPMIISMQEEGFKLYSSGKVDVPPVGYIKQKHPPGSYHIKYGMIEDDGLWVLKIAGGPVGMPLSGMMIALSTETGQPMVLLQDNGYLTQLRTAVAGLICAKYLAPKSISAIGILGTGKQARLQVEILKDLTVCREICVWGRSIEKTKLYQRDMEDKGYKVRIASSSREVVQDCNLIVTTTASRAPLIKSEDVRPGTHITAMGADAPGKHELDPALFTKTDVVVVDSKPQCIDHGEIFQAYQQKLIADKDLIELGQIISNPSLGRTSDNQITIADLTGVAIQDIQIAKSVITIIAN